MLLVHEISLKEEVNVNDLIKRLHWFDVGVIQCDHRNQTF